MFNGVIELREMTARELREYRRDLYWLDAEYGCYADWVARVETELLDRGESLGGV